jgi:hypothetical protein
MQIKALLSSKISHPLYLTLGNSKDNKPKV